MINKLQKIHVPLTLLLVIVVTILPLQAAGAKSPNPDGLIPAGETLQGSQFIFAPEINIAGTVDGDVFAFGQDVTLTGEIKGSLFVLSTTAAIEGQLEGDLYTATSRLSLEPTSTIGRSAYILAGIVNMLPGSQIGRDLYLIGLSGEISGTVGRYQRVHIGLVEILEMLVGENGLLNPLLPPGFKLPWSGINNLAARPWKVLHFTPGSGLGLSALGAHIVPAHVPDCINRLAAIGAGWDSCALARCS
jgi:cytoskeletal protein CcmA (bactofilin family)